ncbi:cytochrome P450 2D6 isoform A [Alligator mississippiensis]|uniref:Cytochrome P450 2D6 isoform A n=1 Tax=Alligator mississippiensis TaxID=8496 RepID=A0A151LYY0_ALLMI|nr:cytochrome P450 2D6 isoform A [Alligator mississippiensis]
MYVEEETSKGGSSKEYKRSRSWSRYPPGPTSLPFLGTILQVNFYNPHLSFNQLSKKFGNVFSLQYFWTNVVVLNGYEAVKDALVQKAEDFADRPYFPRYEHLGYNKCCEGLIISRYGPAWREQRRFALSTLKNFGMGKKSLENQISQEAGFLCSAFSCKEGHSFDPLFLIKKAVSNVIYSLTFGERFDYDDEKFQRLVEIFQQAMKEETGFLPQLLNEVPFLLRIPGVPQKVFQYQRASMSLVDEILNKHKETWESTHIKDFTDAFLQEVEKTKEGVETSFTYENLRLVAVDLFSAGTETSTTTLCWAVLYMLLHPEVQRKVHEEIDKVIGRDRSPNMLDQANMPYTNAVIHEIQRYGDILPIGLPHMTYQDTELQGFFIPKDETFWEKPHQFYPEHFLDADGQFVKREAFLPFSAGRRMCLGEQLARMELFLFFTSLLQCFTFQLNRQENVIHDKSSEGKRKDKERIDQVLCESWIPGCLVFLHSLPEEVKGSIVGSEDFLMMLRKMHQPRHHVQNLGS